MKKKKLMYVVFTNNRGTAYILGKGYQELIKNKVYYILDYQIVDFIDETEDKIFERNYKSGDYFDNITIWAMTPIEEIDCETEIEAKLYWKLKYKGLNV